MSRFSRFFPTAKLANVVMLLLCLFECFSFYQTGFERGYQSALDLALRATDPSYTHIMELKKHNVTKN